LQQVPAPGQKWHLPSGALVRHLRIVTPTWGIASPRSRSASPTTAAIPRRSAGGSCGWRTAAQRALGNPIPTVT